MDARVITLAWDSASGEFDDEPLRQHLAQAQVVSVHPSFFHIAGAPCWSVLVFSHGAESPRRKALAPGESVPTSGSPMTALERERVSMLKAWRTARAQADGVPPYILLVNRQIEAIARLSTISRASLKSVHGLGEARIERFGHELVQLLNGESATAPPVPELNEENA